VEKIKQIINRKWDFSSFEKISNIISNFSISQKVLFYALCLILVLSTLTMVDDINDLVSVNVPTNGGYVKEGIIGSPRFINPVLAVSDVDHDLTALIYSGLVRSASDNSLVPDLAKEYKISDDGLTYTFTLRDDIYFQDGKKVTADDVEFTINKIQDSTIKSPRRPSFYDVKFEKISDKEIVFTLKKPYSPFLENLTVGILPKHLWNNLSADEFPLSQYNVEPIGSGPYKISDMKTLQKNMLLIPTYYELTPFNKYIPEKAFIDKIIINFYKDETTLIDAYNNGDIESINSISPNKMSDINKQKWAKVLTSPLPRDFIVFFNQSQSAVLAYKEVRQALNMATNRQQIVDEVLGGYGKPIYGPIPAGLMNAKETVDIYNTEEAEKVLTKAGWARNKDTGIMEKKSGKKMVSLDISMATLNSLDLQKTAGILKENWEKIGARVDIKEFEFGDLQQNIIRPRKFDALLYGIVIGRDMDFFAFWHSSQRNDPGLNISMYANSKVDKLLEDARKTLDVSVRMSKYASFEEELKKDTPAIFLYSPEFIYIVPGKIKGLELGTVTLPYERFLDVNDWYIDTNNIWKIFE
jgi:peptide/nickel transport system substrate-binding protein